MLGLTLPSALSLIAVCAAMNQDFISSAEIDIAACPITFYGLKYDKVYVGFDSNTSTVCFNGKFGSGPNSDCILMSRGSADRGSLTTHGTNIPTGSGIHELLPNLKHAGECVNIIPLRDDQDSDVKQIELANFGAQAVVGIKTHSGFSDINFEAQTMVNGQSYVKNIFHTNKTNKGVVTDVSGCRLFGAVYKTNTSVWNADICSTVSCDEFGVASPVSTCGPMERCQGNNTCTLDATCTVTGSTIIDVMGQVHAVADRCGYKLMEHESIPDLQVLGVFSERRRKDVSFIERVILHLKSSNVHISLEQGGRVKLDDKVLQFNTSEQIVQGVKVTKGPTGITAEVTAASGYTASIHFNGNTAHIRVTGPKVASVSGLCGNSSTTVAEEKDSGVSESGCETTYTEDADTSINCNETAKWCDVLKQQPFSACHQVVDPEPFISACSSSLCKYPAVDGFNCDLLEAYSRTCSMHNVNVEEWRPQTKCAETHTTCQDTYCSEHEFCGGKHNGWESACLCRAIFASKYRPTNTFGEPTMCKDLKATLTLAACLLEESGVDYNTLHMNDESCVGQVDNVTHMVTFSFDETNTCGSVVKSNGSNIIYENSIKTQNSSNFGIITRHEDAQVEFSCHIEQPDIKSVGIRIKDSSVMLEMESGEWKYNLTMNVFIDEDHGQILTPDMEIEVDQMLYIEMAADGLDEKLLSLTLDSCWATPEPSPNSSLKYSIVGGGCPNPQDKSVTIANNGKGLSIDLSFSMFQFTSRTVNVYLHCKAMVCVNEEATCVPKCDKVSRRRRSATPDNLDQNPGLIGGVQTTESGLYLDSLLLWCFCIFPWCKGAAVQYYNSLYFGLFRK